MISGPVAAVQRLEPIFKAIEPGTGDVAPIPGREKPDGTADQGYLHCEANGNGHFLKMV